MIEMKEDYAINTIDLMKVYRIGHIEIPALNGVNLKVKKGEFISIVGPSGSGKSTLLNMLGALDRPTSGYVFIDGVNIFSLNDNQLAEFRNLKIGFVFQAYNLIPRATVIKNVELPMITRGIPKSERLKRAYELLKRVGLSDKIYRKPLELSGGEQQRVAIARALVNRPSIVLADEPTGNVDSKTSYEIVELLKEINSEFGTTFIIVTHNPEVANATERIVHLRDGKIYKEEEIP
ncbi:MAG: ABC transporter ATP-binding protein [Candidatus Bathyarchaeia archaeon]